MVRGVIFDLDGTLLNTLESLERSGTLMLQELGLPPQEAEAYKYFAGSGATELVRRVLIAAGDTELKHFEEGSRLYKKYFAEWCNYHVAPYPGIPEALRALKEKGMLLAVLSNKPHMQTVEVISRYFDDDIFSSVRGQSEEVPKKPDPTGAKLTLEGLGISAEECLYVGDSGVDMQTGRAAGLYTIGVLWGFRKKEELVENGAQAVIEHPEELLKLVKQR